MAFVIVAGFIFSTCSALRDVKQAQPSASADSILPAKPHKSAVVRSQQVDSDTLSQRDSSTFQFHHDKALDGNVDSMYRLAQCYLNGTGCDRDTNAALGWLRSASSVGHTLSSDLLSTLTK